MRILIVVVLLLLAACSAEKNEGLEPVTGKHVLELEQTACNAAHDANTCSTKLAELGFITKEECCAKYGKCC